MIISNAIISFLVSGPREGKQDYSYGEINDSLFRNAGFSDGNLKKWTKSRPSCTLASPVNFKVI